MRPLSIASRVRLVVRAVESSLDCGVLLFESAVDLIAWVTSYLGIEEQLRVAIGISNTLPIRRHSPRVLYCGEDVIASTIRNSCQQSYDQEHGRVCLPSAIVRNANIDRVRDEENVVCRVARLGIRSDGPLLNGSRGSLSRSRN